MPTATTVNNGNFLVHGTGFLSHYSGNNGSGTGSPGSTGKNVCSFVNNGIGITGTASFAASTTIGTGKSGNNLLHARIELYFKYLGGNGKNKAKDEPQSTNY